MNQANIYQVSFTARAAKAGRQLPRTVKEQLALLAKEIELNGPVRGNWRNYGKLSSDCHHCHIKRGRPTYVCCWRIIGERIVEIYYAGTHEKAPY